MNSHLGLCCDLSDYGVSHSVKFCSQCAGHLCLPDQVVVTAVLCITNMYLNCITVSIHHSVFFMIPASPLLPPPIAQKL
jgi:hypothetical protein